MIRFDTLNDKYGNPLERREKVDATTDPTVTDDFDAGYEAGSQWLNVTSEKVFVCIDHTVGAAVWIEVTNPDHDHAEYATLEHEHEVPETHIWMPLTTVIDGEPYLVWDEGNSLIPTKIPL